MKIKTLLLSGLFCLAACSSAPQKQTQETQEDIVIERIDGLEHRPKWLIESEPFRIESGYVTSLGQTEIPGDNRVEAGYRIAENNSKSALSSAIEQRLEFIFTGAEEGTSLDANQARWIGAEASKITTSSMRNAKRYYEKIAHTTDDGERTTKYRIFTLVQMPEADFKKAILDAARKREGKGGLSADFAKKVNSHWDSFVHADVQPKQQEAQNKTEDARNPASDKQSTDGKEAEND
ncbi:MAG: hypothetical protein AB7F43_07710 [Bacteriovoracia bacterium]